MKSNAFQIVIGNLASKLIGLAREVVFANWFGTGAIAAGYRISQTAYLLPTQALIGDSLSAGLLPLYRELRSNDVDHGRAIVLVAAAVAGSISMFAALFLFMFSGSIARFIAPGATQEALTTAQNLLRIMALSTPFFVLSGMLSYIETAFGRFGAIAWRPMLLNVGAIGGALLAFIFDAYQWLAIGVVASHLAFFIWTGIQFRGLDAMLPSTSLERRAWVALTVRLLKNMAPLIGLPFLAQCMILVERMVSSYLGTQVIPSVDYARFVSDTMVQLIAVPLGILTMARRGGEKSAEASNDILRATKLSFLLALPVAVLCALAPEEIVRLLFERGAFNNDSVASTSTALRWMGAALVFSVPGYYLVKALNAQLRNNLALLVTFLGVIASISVNLVFWRHLGVATIGFAYAAYNIVIAVGAGYLLDIGREMRRLALASLPFIVALVVAIEGMRALLSGVWVLFVAIPISAAVWIAAAVIIPDVRTLVAMPLLSKVAKATVERRQRE